jgi:hypothetical protein
MVAGGPVIKVIGTVPRSSQFFCDERAGVALWQAAPVPAIFSTHDEGAPGPSPLGIGEGISSIPVLRWRVYNLVS